MKNEMTTTILPDGSTIEKKFNIKPGEIEEIFSTLVTNRERPKMRESIFAGVFLPIILGAVDARGTNWLDRWMHEVGSLQLAVDIHSDTTKELLFTAPPLFTFADFNNEYGKSGFGRIIDEGKRLGTNFPVVGERYIADKLGEKLDEITEGKSFDSDERWVYIFERYGYDIVDGEVVKLSVEELRARQSGESVKEVEKPTSNEDDATLGLFNFG